MKRRFYRRFGKRVFDLCVASVALLILSPILLLLAVLVRCFLGTPVFFRQRRPGLAGAAFTILKFRTMIDPREGEDPLLSDANRLTSFGRFLRGSSLDEIPELINVVRGEMSLVGPRPLLMQYLPRYTSEQMRRHEVRPGVTGWAQVNGRNTLSWPKRFSLDVWYVDHYNFWLDLKILLLTFQKVRKREGITAENHATMKEFMG